MRNYLDGLRQGEADHARHNAGTHHLPTLALGERAGARFSEDGRYRPLLFRIRDSAADPPDPMPHPDRAALFIGLNPSGARQDVDDQTIRTELNFTRHVLGFGIFIKMNLMDYRQRDPKALLRLPLSELRSAENLPLLCDLAARVHRSGGWIICAWGLPKPKLSGFETETLTALGALPVPLSCRGRAGEEDRHPHHSLYIRASTPLEPFD